MSFAIDAGCIREPQLDQVVPDSCTRGIQGLFTSRASTTEYQCEQHRRTCDASPHHTQTPTIDHHMHLYKTARELANRIVLREESRQRDRTACSAAEQRAATIPVFTSFVSANACPSFVLAFRVLHARRAASLAQWFKRTSRRRGTLRCDHSLQASRLMMKRFTTILCIAALGCAADGESRGVTFTAGPTPLTFAAVQDGDGPWLAVTPSADGVYSFEPRGPTYGIAAVCGDEAYAWTMVVQATIEETRSPSFPCSIYAETFGTVQGTIAGTPAAQFVTVHIANRTDWDAAGAYTTTSPSGEWDMFAVHSVGPIGTVLPERIVRRNAVVVSDAAPVRVDFDFMADGFEIEAHSVSFEGMQPNESVDVRVALENEPGNTMLQLGPFETGRYSAFPRSELRADESQLVTATATSRDGTAYRQVRRWFVAAEDFTAALPAVPPPPVVGSDGATPYLLMRGTIPTGLDADRYEFVYSQPRTASYMMWTASLTRGYVASGATTYTLPDLTGVAGFLPVWGLMGGGADVEWQLLTTSSDASVADLFDADVPATRLDGRRDEVTRQSGRFPR